MSKPFHNPFESLGALKDRLPASPEPTPVRPAPVVPTSGKTYPKAVVRYERSGRGGKAVTVIEQLNLRPAERETWLKELKASIGCGGVVEGENLVLQGDHRKRLSAILSARGVRKVTLSN